MGFDKSKAINAAEKCLAQGKIAQAAQEYCKIVEHEPQDFTALNTLGDLYVRLGKTQEAVGCFLRVAEHYREQGFALKAVAVYKKTLRMNPDAPGVSHNLAVLYEQQGLYVEARTQYLQIADAAARAGQLRESLAALRRIADFDPRNIEIRLRLAEGWATEQMSGAAAEAFVEAGELLLARGDSRQALDAYKRAHALDPASHAVLQGLVAASVAVGDVDEAAAVMERAAADRPADLELRAMLARTYIDAEDATAAERATESLVQSDPSSYPLLFEVARLYLQRSYVSEAVRVLSRAIDPALTGRQETVLHEILNEALARDPEHIDALKLLLRIYTWQRDDERMHVTLERLAEAAQTHQLPDEERRALEHLVRLVPFDQSYHERLEALGGARSTGEDVAAPAPPPAFETAGSQSYEFDPFAAAPHADADAFSGGAEFEWNTVEGLETSAADAFAAPPAFASPSSEFAANEFAADLAHADPSASFADLNEDFAAEPAPRADATVAFDLSFGQPAAFDQSPAPDPAAFDPQEVHVTDSFGEISFDTGGGTDVSTSERAQAMLAQELESVDFYLEQGYGDIARDTLDMLERQYGASAEIAARRSRLPAEIAATLAPPPNGNGASGPNGNGAAGSNGNGTAHGNGAARAKGEAATLDGFASYDFQPADPAALSADPFAAAAPPPASKQQPASSASSSHASPAPPAPPAPSIDPGLAALFDEFRESVEDEAAAPEEDFETTYNLGLAYKEMDLADEAVEQFQKASTLVSPADGTSRYFQCCTMLGHCFMQKRIPRAAAIWFKKALAVPGLNDDESQALRYELALAYEEMGDIDSAINTFSEVYGVDVNYRGVAERLQNLQARKASAVETP